MFDINDYDHTIFTYYPNLDYLEEIPEYLCEISVKMKAELQAFLLIARLLADKFDTLIYGLTHFSEDYLA